MQNGSALAVNYAAEHAAAILEAWYPGEEGGTAIAETLAGDNNPAGRLPVTFYRSLSQLPPFDDYAMKSRTYRYMTEKPLFPFGYGLSYTTFRFGAARLAANSVKAGDSIHVLGEVTNTGGAAGDEVAELYLVNPKRGCRRGSSLPASNVFISSRENRPRSTSHSIRGQFPKWMQTENG